MGAAVVVIFMGVVTLSAWHNSRMFEERSRLRKTAKRIEEFPADLPDGLWWDFAAVMWSWSFWKRWRALDAAKRLKSPEQS